MNAKTEMRFHKNALCCGFVIKITQATNLFVDFNNAKTGICTQQSGILGTKGTKVQILI